MKTGINKVVRIRSKGVAIVKSSKGILLVAGRRKVYALPGGGANKGESRKHAAIRELREETGLKAKKTKFLISYNGRKWQDYKGKSVRNHAKVFLVEAYGKLRPRKEIKHVAWYKQGSKLRVSSFTKDLLGNYLK